MNPYLNQYQNNQVSTASPEQILIMLYDGAIRFANQAAEAIAERDVEKRNLYINKTMAIISEFNATLDHEIGGEIAANLADLYDFMLRELTRANLKNDAQILGPVLNILTDLREAWVQAAEIVKKEKTPPGNAGVADHKPFAAAL